MPETYRINGGCTFPTLDRINMPARNVNNTTSKVNKIVAKLGSGTSWEYDNASSPSADIFFPSGMFTTLKDNVNVRNVYVTYDAPAIKNAPDQIYYQSVTLNYP